MVQIEIFRCCLATGFSDKTILTADNAMCGRTMLRTYLEGFDPSLWEKYQSSVRRVVKRTSEGVKVFYSPKRGVRYYLFIKWYEQHHAMV